MERAKKDIKPVEVEKEGKPEIATQVTQVDHEPKKIRYQKIGGGSLRLPGRIIKPNEKFMAYPEEIPIAFKRWIIPLEPVPDENTPVNVTSSIYKIVPREGSDTLFDVVNAEGKVMNAKDLTEKKAQELLKEL